MKATRGVIVEKCPADWLAAEDAFPPTCSALSWRGSAYAAVRRQSSAACDEANARGSSRAARRPLAEHLL